LQLSEVHRRDCRFSRCHPQRKGLVASHAAS
jgi:hypothetical protein